MKYEEMQKKRDAAWDEVKKWDALISAFRAVCEHDWKYAGHGHNYDFYECAKCREGMRD